MISRLLSICLLLLSAPAWAVYPTVVGESDNQTDPDADTDTHVFQIPDGCNTVGLRVVLSAAIDGVTSGASFSVTDPTGFTELAQSTYNSSAGSGDNRLVGHVWERIVDGSEGWDGTGDTATMTLTGTGNLQRAAMKSWCIDDHDSAEAGEATVAQVATSTTGTDADPPSITPTPGSRDYLILAVGMKDTGDGSVSSYPTGYTNTGSRGSGLPSASSSGSMIAWAREEVTGTSEDPVTFVFSEAEEWIAFTIAIPGTTGSSDTTPDAFSFTDQTGVALSSTITSTAVTITGIDTTITCTATSGTIDRNGNGTFQASYATIVSGDTIRAQHTSSGSYSTAVNTPVTCGGVSDTFTSTTLADPGGGASIPAIYQQLRQMKK